MKVHHLLLCAVICSKIATAAPPETQAVEFFNASLGHYFVTADAAEAVGIDAGGAGSGWARTGRYFGAWLNASNAPAGSAAVCRFYSSGANSHFFTANAAECASLKTLESAQRQDAIQSSRAFTGWTFEGIAFTAVAPSGAAACVSGTEKIFRAYNDGFASGELVKKSLTSLRVLLVGYAVGILCAGVLTVEEVGF